MSCITDGVQVYFVFWILLHLVQNLAPKAFQVYSKYTSLSLCADAHLWTPLSALNPLHMCADVSKLCSWWKWLSMCRRETRISQIHVITFSKEMDRNWNGFNVWWGVRIWKMHTFSNWSVIISVSICNTARFSILYKFCMAPTQLVPNDFIS